jgi:GTPase involved in cell partitioning and DNA repair
MADLPGLLEGAHLNHGLGHSFLRHIERTKLLLLVADVNGFRLSPKHPFRSCLETVVLLNRELELYDETLFNKPAILVINKLDTPGSKEIFEEVLEDVENLNEIMDEMPEDVRPKHVIKFKKVFGMSASEGPKAVVDLKKTLKDMMDDINPEENVDDYTAEVNSAK